MDETYRQLIDLKFGARQRAHPRSLLQSFPSYPRGITVPAIVDIESGAVVTNNFPQITEDFAKEWAAFHRDGTPDLWSAELEEEMRAVMKRIYTEVNNGVYRCGFAGSQESYEAAYERLGSYGLARRAPGNLPLPHG